MAIERKYERDVDLLLAEEFAVSPGFAERFKALTKFAARPSPVADVWVSKSNNLGESDLIVLYGTDASERFALLIEDKIDAPLQPDQARRYRLRADRERAAGNFVDYEVLLCAPRFYIERRGDLADFDRVIPFEEIAELFTGQEGARACYRRDFLNSAGTRRVNKWSREDDATTNAFWNAAYDIASGEFPQLEMKQLKLTKNSAWITLRPHDFPTRPKGVHIAFKGDRGLIDLTFKHTEMYLFEPSVRDFLEPGMTLHQTKASTAIRLRTDGFRVADGPGPGEAKLRQAFGAASRLIAFYRRFKPRLDEAAMAATRQ